MLSADSPALSPITHALSILAESLDRSIPAALSLSCESNCRSAFGTMKLAMPPEFMFTFGSAGLLIAPPVCCCPAGAFFSSSAHRKRSDAAFRSTLNCAAFWFQLPAPCLETASRSSRSCATTE